MEYDPSLPWRDVRGGGFNSYLGAPQVAVFEDRTHFALQLDERHMNSVGVCHGGVLMSLADTGMGTCAYFGAGERPVATIDFDANFLAAAKNEQMLHGVARVLRRAREFLFMQGEMWAGDRQVLRCSGIWAIRSTGKSKQAPL